MEGGHLRRDPTASIALWRFDLLSHLDSLQHCVTGRQGGVSDSPYASLNLGLHVGDDPAKVVENRRRVCRALDVDFELCTFAQQVHGSGICLVGEKQAGAGRTEFEDGLPDTDALVIARPGHTIVAVVADCVPMLLYDTERHTGAVVHAGWRGTAARIAESAVRFLVEQCGSRPQALLAGIGPAIGLCCYQVSGEVAAQVSRSYPYAQPVAESRDGDWRLDLAAANRQQLLAAGLLPANIEPSGVCTACTSEDFYSERRLGRPTGRFGIYLSLA